MYQITIHARTALAAACVAAMIPLAAHAQQSPQKSTTTQQAESSKTESPRPQKTRVIITKDNGKSTTRVFVDSSEIALDVPELTDSIRTRIREALKDVGEISIDGKNGSFNLFFKRGNGKEDNVFSFQIDSNMRALSKSLGRLGHLRMMKRDGWMRPPLPPMPPAGRAYMWDWSDRPEFTTDGAKKLEAEAEAMKTEAEAMRKEAEAMRKEADAIRKRAEALRLEAKAKKAKENENNGEPATTPSKKEQKK